MIAIKSTLSLLAVGLIATLSAQADARVSNNKLSANKLSANRIVSNKSSTTIINNKLAANGLSTAGAGAVSDVVTVKLRDGREFRR